MDDTPTLTEVTVPSTETILVEAVRLLERWKAEVASWSISYGLRQDTFAFFQNYNRRSTLVICKACARAAADGEQGEKSHKEYGCKGGTHCDCQHRVGTLETFFNPTTVAQILAGGNLTSP